MISEDFFAIKFKNFFDANVKDKIKEFQSKGKEAVHWDFEKKEWVCKLELYQDIYLAVEKYCTENAI